MQLLTNTLVYINKTMKTSVFYLILFCLVTGFSVGCKSKSTDARCSMPAESGICMAAIPKYYYNQTSGQCEQFTWGGCGDFPFETMEACEQTCE